jgi:outer membrane protein TolC
MTRNARIGCRFWALAAVLLAGCQTPSKQEFDQREAAVDLRQLYEPLASTDPALLERLDSLEAGHVAFELSPAGAAQLPYSLPDDVLWSEQRAVFYRIEGDSGPEWLYFSGATLRVEPVTPPFAADGGLVPAADGGFSIYRSVPVRKGGVIGTGDLDLFRYDFTLSPEGKIEATGVHRVTAEAGADLQPVPLGGVDRVIYIHQKDDAPHELRIGDSQGGPARPLFEGQDFDAILPALLSDGRLVFLSDQLGYYSLFQLADAEAYVRALESHRAEDPAALPDWRTLVRPVEYPLPAARAKHAIFVASVPKNGRLVPALLRVPENLDMPAIARLVEAHNPRVNEMRARYAAALIGAARFKLNNWPKLDLGLSFEDHIQIFDNMPVLFPGDTLTQHAFTLFMGIAQPLLDFKQNQAFTQGALKDAETAQHRLAAEINDRTAEAADLYFEAVHLTRQIDLETAQLALTERRANYHRTLREKGESTRLQLMAVQQVAEGLTSERAFHGERLAFLHSRLKEVMGLPSDLQFSLVPARFDFHAYALPPLEQAITRALANHPTLLAAKSATASAFYQQAAGPEIRPRAGLSANYQRLDQDYKLGSTAGTTDQSRAQEMATLALTGEVPLASWRAKRLNTGFWTEMLSALRLAEEAEARRVRSAVEEATMDFRAAQRDFDAKAATQAFELEKLRVARLHREFGPPGAPITFLRPPDEPGAIEGTLGTGVLAPLSAEFEYLRAADRRSAVEMDLGRRLARVAREMGDTRVLLDVLDSHAHAAAARGRPAVWMWNSRQVLASDEALDNAVEKLRGLRARRVYVYLFDQGALLIDRKLRERLTQLIELCAQRDIETWALLGEPEWIKNNCSQCVGQAVARVRDFNALFGDFEPKLAGIKLDLEPHSQPGWNEGGASRKALEANWFNLLQSARDKANGALPLWADLPVKFFQPEERALLDRVAGLLDGATLMDYFNAEKPISEWADSSLRAFDKPLEIGLELSPKAPAEDTLAAWTPDRVQALRAALNEFLAGHGNFAGLALHDYEALNPGARTE